MRRPIRRRPEIESLESMTLLSGMSGGAHQALEALAKTPTFPNPLHLVGTVHGTFKAKGGGETAKVSGSLSPVGKVSFSGPVGISAVSGTIGSLAIPTKVGKLLVSFNLMPAGQTATGSYTINGGTKAFAGETGSGSVTVNVTPSGSFVATFS